MAPTLHKSHTKSIPFTGFKVAPHSTSPGVFYRGESRTEYEPLDMSGGVSDDAKKGILTRLPKPNSLQSSNYGLIDLDLFQVRRGTYHVFAEFNCLIPLFRLFGRLVHHGGFNVKLSETGTRKRPQQTLRSVIKLAYSLPFATI